MAIALQLVNGFPRTVSFSATGQPDIYDQRVSIVASGGNAPSSLNGPVTAGTAVTLPANGSYTLNSASIANIQVYLNGQRIDQVYEWTTSGSGPTFTAIQFTFQLNVGDNVDIRSERAT